MRQDLPHNPEHAPIRADPSWSACEERIKAFEEAWLRGQTPPIADYLVADEPLRHALLIELVHIDLEFRLKSGTPARVESYLGRFPELADDREAVLDMIATEYALRQRLDGSGDPLEYGMRFPGYAEDLARRLPSPSDPEAATRLDRPAPRLTPGPCASVPGYEVLAELGRGGMGVICKARDLRLGRIVALKFLPSEYAHSPDRMARFMREARTASSLNHPHICTIYELGEQDGRPFIVMEFIAGRTLNELIGQRPGIRETARLIAQVAEALAVAHAAGIVHRDIKPDNIMVRADGYVKVVDFGLARHLPELAGAGPERKRDTAPGTLLGTVAYMSPEQARGEPVDSASDLFSLGIVLYELATGEHPFDADTSLGILQAIVYRQPLPASRLNPEIPPALESLLDAMLQKDARRRPSATQVEAALSALASGENAWSRRALASAAPPTTVGRRPELAALRAALADAEMGRGSLLCVSGEPGIGKTTLVEDFLRDVNTSGGRCLVARGRCSERLADAEVYLPVIEALEDLLRGEASGSVASLMKVVAPTWYAQVAPLAREAGSAATSEAGRASSQQALKREFCRVLEEVARLAPLILFLDDLHWADLSTVDLLAHLARNVRATRILIILTFRPTELLLGPHPFHPVKLDLQSQGVCRELALGFLAREDIDSYLARTFPDHDLPADFASLIHARTEGNPLFMADLLAYLRSSGVIAQMDGRWRLARELPDLWRELPESVRAMIHRKMGRLSSDERRLLAAAGLQGQEFDSTTVAAALGLDPADVEERLSALDRVHGVVRLVREQELPDRTLSLRYRFVHVLYQHALQAELAPSRRAALSTALAVALERHHGEGNATIAAELACLYESGRDFSRAARHFCLAARNAARVFAHLEAAALARRGLGLLSSLPETPERAAVELPLQVTLGMQLQVTDGFAAPLARQAYLRARELCAATSGSVALFPILWGLWLYHKVRSELQRAREMANELFELARELNDPALAMQAQQALAVTTLCRGEPAATLRHMEQGAALYDHHRHRGHSWQFGQDPGVACKAFGALALWLLGYPDEAERQSQEAIRLSRELAQPSSQTLALHFAAMLYQCRRASHRAREYATASAAIATEQRFSFWLAGATVMRGWADGELNLLCRGLEDWQATGSVTYRTYYLALLAEVHTKHEQIDAGLRVADEALALVEATGEGLYAAELHRLRGELLARRGDRQRALECFCLALDTARQQEARSLELRAATSLARLVRSAEARAELANLLDWFTEGHKTPDHEEARAVLASLA